jgi:hypothetical protein
MLLVKPGSVTFEGKFNVLAFVKETSTQSLFSFSAKTTLCLSERSSSAPTEKRQSARKKFWPIIRLLSSSRHSAKAVALVGKEDRKTTVNNKQIARRKELLQKILSINLLNPEGLYFSKY